MECGGDAGWEKSVVIQVLVTLPCLECRCRSGVFRVPLCFESGLRIQCVVSRRCVDRRVGTRWMWMTTGTFYF